MNTDKFTEKFKALIYYFYKDDIDSLYISELKNIDEKIEEITGKKQIDRSNVHAPTYENAAIRWCLTIYLTPFLLFYKEKNQYDSVVGAINLMTDFSVEYIESFPQHVDDFVNESPFGLYRYFWEIYELELEPAFDLTPRRDPFAGRIFLVIGMNIYKQAVRELDLLK
jgi:hypothetical protein